MSRVSWKFLYFTEYDLYTFYEPMVGVQAPWDSFRNKTINNLNIDRFYNVHQGNVYVSFETTIYHLGWKLGAFSKTRKPFFFRSKKKKK